MIKEGKVVFTLKLHSCKHINASNGVYAAALNSKDDPEGDFDSLLVFDLESIKLFKLSQPLETFSLLKDKILVKYFDGSM